MPPKRGKWASPGARGSRGRPPAPRGRFRDFVPAAHMGAPSNAFSMRDEAKNTASHSSLAWISGDAKLRQKPVTFVSAGVIEPLKEDKPLDESAVPSTVEEPTRDVLDTGAIEILEEKKPLDDSADPNTAEKPTGGVLDALGKPADVKEAEVSGIVTIDVLETETTVQVLEQECSVTNLPLRAQGAGDADLPSSVQGNETKDFFSIDLGEDDEPTIDICLPRPKVPSPRSSFGGSDSSEEVILYRGRNGLAQGAAPKDVFCYPSTAAGPSKAMLPQRPKPAPPTSEEPTSLPAKAPVGASQKKSEARGRRSRASQVMGDHVEDDDEDAVLADYIANMAANSEDDFFAHLLQSSSNQRDIGGDHEAVNFGSGDEKSPRGDNMWGDRESIISGTSDAEEDDIKSDGEDEDMDADMDDETLARLLAKQEELGLGSDGLLLFSSSLAKTGTRRKQGKRLMKPGSSSDLRGPASATQAAGAFDILDLADWSQLTGQSRKRRSKQPPNFNVSDSEVESALKSAWQRDRERKKNRKLERETLRAEGMLGKHANPDDLRVRYPSGMKLDDMKAELTSFLLGSAERLDFPPLDKHARKVLHELANKFNIKSQSTGKGDQRRPVLYRTNRTVRYASTRVEDATTHVDQAALRIHRKYFHRVDVKVQKTETPRNAGGGRGGAGHKALSLREGEIVGASVPELGQENKGRNMLEKMGWSKGMALGSLNNKGILEPVAQVMKRSKAGLG
ncbi:hypothetical protein N658DRAFT_497948 [Parathielavia hyrcaniae]|uniref:Protein SQS1 n=1 Tax=Parathielavia hyrcaniae TaxID=113614 RepID=A0AAN6PY54_9PEZI|nr:hypothetical protein N658DRAFT_497948 [Parathielavia hyrcaniae]